MGTPVSTVEVLQKKAYETLRSEKPTEAELDALQKTFENEHGSQVLEQLRAQVDVQAKEAPFIMANLDELSKRVGTKVELRAELGKFSTELRVKSDAATLDAAQKAEAQLKQSVTPTEKSAQEKKVPAGAPKSEEDHKIRNYLLGGAGVIVTALGIRWLYKRFMSSREEGKKAAEAKEGGWFKKLLWGAGIGTAAFFGWHAYKGIEKTGKVVAGTIEGAQNMGRDILDTFNTAKETMKGGVKLAERGTYGVGNAVDRMKGNDPTPKLSQFKTKDEYHAAAVKYLKNHNDVMPSRESCESDEAYEEMVIATMEAHLKSGGETTLLEKGGRWLLTFGKVSIDVLPFYGKVIDAYKEFNLKNGGELLEAYTEGGTLYACSFGVLSIPKLLTGQFGTVARRVALWPLMVPAHLYKGGKFAAGFLVDGADHPLFISSKAQIDAAKHQMGGFIKNRLLSFQATEEAFEKLAAEQLKFQNYASNNRIDATIRTTCKEHASAVADQMKRALEKFVERTGQLPRYFAGHPNSQHILDMARSGQWNDTAFEGALKGPKLNAPNSSSHAQPSSAPTQAKVSLAEPAQVQQPEARALRETVKTTGDQLGRKFFPALREVALRIPTLTEPMIESLAKQKLLADYFLGANAGTQNAIVEYLAKASDIDRAMQALAGKDANALKAFFEPTPAVPKVPFSQSFKNFFKLENLKSVFLSPANWIKFVKGAGVGVVTDLTLNKVGDVAVDQVSKKGSYWNSVFKEWKTTGSSVASGAAGGGVVGGVVGAKAGAIGGLVLDTGYKVFRVARDTKDIVGLKWGEKARGKELDEKLRILNEQKAAKKEMKNQ